MSSRVCKKCGKKKPLTAEYFNEHQPGYWRHSCKTCMAAHSRNYHMRNPDKVYLRVKRYQDRKRSAGTPIGDDDKQMIRFRFGDRCYFCRKCLDSGGEWDHKIPISRGGNNSRKNMLLVCRTCNRDKHSKTDLEYIDWMKQRGRPFRFDLEKLPT